MVDNILCSFQNIPATNIAATNLVDGGIIGAVTALARKQDKYSIAVGS